MFIEVSETFLMKDPSEEVVSLVHNQVIAINDTWRSSKFPTIAALKAFLSTYIATYTTYVASTLN